MQYKQCRAIAFGRQSSPDLCADAHETMGPQRMSCKFSLPFWSNPYSTDVTAFLLVSRLDQSVRWWIRRCLACQARKTSRQTIRWPTTLMTLPNGPGQIVSVDYFGPFTDHSKRQQNILLYTDRFTRRVAAHAVCMYVCMVITYSRVWINRVKLSILLVVS